MKLSHFLLFCCSLFPLISVAEAVDLHSASYAEIYFPSVDSTDDKENQNIISNWSNLPTQTIDLSKIDLEEVKKEVWVKVVKPATNIESMLVIQSRIIDKVEYWQFGDGKSISSGIVGPAAGQFNVNLLTTTPVILIDKTPENKEVELYLKIKSPYLKNISIFMKRYNFILIEMEISRFILYFFFGAFFLILVYQGILFYSFEFAASLWYAFFIICFSFNALLLLGVPDYFLAEHGAFHWYDMNWTMTALTSLFAVIFFHAFMDFDKEDPIPRVLLGVGVVGSLLQFAFGIIRLANPDRIESVIAFKDIAIALCATSVLVTGGYAIYRSRPFARIATFAWSPLIIFVIADPLGLIPKGNAYLKAIPLVPTLFEMLVMSIALSMKLSAYYTKAVHAEEQTKQNDFLKHILRALSHDMANHFFVAENYLKLGILQEKIPESVVRLKKIQDSIAKTKELLARVRTWIQAGDRALKIELADIDALPILKQSIEIFEDRAKLKGVTIELRAENGKEYPIRAERVSLLNQIFNNLISNAIKFSFKGSKIILTLNEDSNQVEFIIQDFGTGIPTHDLKAFNELGNIQSREGTSSEKGTGFGMGLIKFYSAAFGANLSVKSSIASEDHGTEIRIKFVRANSESSKAEMAS